MNIILYAQTGCAITSGTIISDGINFELNTQNFLPPIVTGPPCWLAPLPTGGFGAALTRPCLTPASLR